MPSPDENSGHVRVYEYDAIGQIWRRLGQELNGRDAQVRAGYSVSLSQNCTHVAFGSEVDGGNQDKNGMVDVYRYDEEEGEWFRVGDSIVGKFAEERAGFSISLSLEGTRIGIGSPYYQRNQGYVKVYDFMDESGWEQLGETLTQDEVDLSGYSVSMSRDGRRITVGSPDDFSYDEDASPHTGRARVFELRDL